jgi:hypothetical protein
MSLKLEIIDLLEELYDYMSDRSDVDGDSEGYYPNKEATLQQEISDVLFKLGSPNHDGGARVSVDPNHKRHEGPINENKKVVKITEADLRRIISENLEGDVSEDGFFGMLAKKAAQKANSAMKTFSNNSSKPLLKKGTQSGFNRVVSTMRTEVAQLLAKTPTIKITPKTIKALEEPKYNVRVAYDALNELATEGLETSIRAEYSSIVGRLEISAREFSKPAGQQLNIKQLMNDLYYVKDEITQDILKRPQLAKDAPRVKAPLDRVTKAINHIETLFKTPDKPTSYLVKEEPKL